MFQGFTFHDICCNKDRLYTLQKGRLCSLVRDYAMLSEFVDWIGFILGRHLIKSQLGLTRLRLPTTIMEESASVFCREFPDHLKLLFLELYRTESHADVTLLSTDEVEFQAPKVVLSGCSPVLKKVMTTDHQKRLSCIYGERAPKIDSFN